MFGDLCLGVIAGQECGTHGRITVGVFLRIMGQRLRDWAALHTGDLVTFTRVAGFCFLDKCLTARVNLPIQLLQDTPQANTGAHEIFISALCGPPVLGKLLQQPSGFEPFRYWALLHHRDPRTPRPFSRERYHASPHRIEYDITRQLPEIRIALNQNRLVAPLKNMADTAHGGVIG